MESPTYPACPSCRTNVVRRSRRKGLLEQTISLLYVYPFCCQLCSCRFYALRWGAKFERRTPKEYARIPAPVRAVPGGPLPLVTSPARYVQAVREVAGGIFPHEVQHSWFHTPQTALDGDCPSTAMRMGNAESVYRLLIGMVRWH